jgi:hypothetical protein
MAKKKVVNKQKKKKMGGLTKLILLLLCVPAFFTIGPTLVFCFFGMLPTIVTAFVEKEDPYKWIAVGGMNISGAFFFLFDLWFGLNTMDAAISMLVNPVSIVVMYGCAGLGVMLYMFFPKICRTILQVAAYKRIALLQQKQRRLIDEWGKELGRQVDSIDVRVD